MAVLHGPEGQGDGRWVLPTPGGPSRRTLVASATKARLASSLTPVFTGAGSGARRPTAGRREVELLQGALAGQVRHPGLDGEVALPANGDFRAQQFGQHLGIGQLPVGGSVQGVVPYLDGLLEAQGFQVLTDLFQGDRATPPATSSYTSRERRSTSPAGICTATASLRGRLSPLGRPDRWPGRMKRCPGCCARGCTAMRSSPAQISTVPRRCPTYTV